MGGVLKNKKVWIGLLLLIVAAWAGIKWTSSKGSAPEWRSVRVERGDIEVAITATGVVSPQNRVEIKPPITTRAEEILVEEGQSVRKGQILALMSSVERATLLDAARAKGLEELKHWEELYKPTPLVAPLSGVIISRKIEPGQTVTGQDAVLVMSNRLIVQTQVDETDIGKVKLGQRASIALDAYPDEKIRGRVDHIAYEAKTVNNVTIYEVDVLFERVPDFARSGMTANVSLITGSKQNVLLVPSDAISDVRDKAVVFVTGGGNGNGRKMTEVTTGLSDGRQTEITSGLAEGDSVAMKAVRRVSRSDGSSRSPFSPFGGRPRVRSH